MLVAWTEWFGSYCIERLFIMTTTFETAQRIVFSSVAALVFAAVAVCTATPMFSIG